MKTAPNKRPLSGKRDLESTQELLDRAHAGDHAAVERIVERYLPLFHRWASGRLPGWARDLLDTDDLVQDTMLQIVPKIEGLKLPRAGVFQAYVRRALQNRLRDELRRVGRRPGRAELTERLTDLSPSPLEAAVGSEALERYEAALDQLSDNDRHAVVARIELGMSYRELAEEMDKNSPDAARMTVSRALLKLAREMKP